MNLEDEKTIELLTNLERELTVLLDKHGVYIDHCQEYLSCIRDKKTHYIIANIWGDGEFELA